ncbi:MAG: N-6 DNA methylase [Chloroflexi bacterium]|nr:N-6 DNA methylase [Chloroflexota bacterium]
MAVASVAGERRKQLGAFYTPPEIVDALAKWAIRSPTDRVLEPASGEAVFVLESLRRLRSLGALHPAEQVLAVDIDPDSCASATDVLAAAGERASIICRDFFELVPDEQAPFMVAIGNPPYVRYHRFRGDARERGRSAAASVGVTLSGLASSWAPFVVHASRFLAPSGRLAFVLPAELLRADYAGPVREFLLERFGSVTVVTFERAVFPGAAIDTVLLLADGSGSRGLHSVQLNDVADLSSLPTRASVSASPIGRWSGMLTSIEGASALDRLRARGLLRRIGDVATVDIGFVSGANKFFVLDAAEIKRHGLSRRRFQPAIVRPSQLPGAVLTEHDAAQLIASDDCLVLNVSASGLAEQTTALGRYLRRGQRLGIHRGYKCRTDMALRQNGPEAAAALVDDLLMNEGVLDPIELEQVRRARDLLRNRRVNRGRSQA